MTVRRKARITSNGQITLPAAVRAKLGVGPGDTLSFEMSNDEVWITRDREPGVFEKWAGRFRSGRGKTASEIDQQIRESRGNPE